MLATHDHAFSSASVQSQPAISVPLAIVLGLIASFIQSLGLTIQRKSHLLNERAPADHKRTEWRRPLWIIGFVIFLCANIGGTVFQIGALPIVMLAPLGAVSLLYNALLARFLLNDFFSKYMVLGTALIAVGAVLIGYFGVVQEPTHSLDDLLALYGRPAFIAFATIFLLAFIGVLAVAHLAEWQLRTHIARLIYSRARPSGSPKKRKSRSKLRRRWSAPTLASVPEVSENPSGIATPVLALMDEAARRDRSTASFIHAGSNAAVRRDPSGGIIGAVREPLSPTHSLNGSPRKQDMRQKPYYGALDDASSRWDEDASKAAATAMEDPAVRRTQLGLAIAYGGASGTLSGACLLLAKSGVELLVLTFAGDNQFNRWQSWMLVVIMLVAALLQLWYLNKSLRLADPTLVCPLAFCFYNTSSIALGLVYFAQLGSLAWYNLVLVALGTVVLLTGVWTVSLHGPGDDAEVDEEAEGGNEETEALLANAAGIGGPHLPPPATHSPITSEPEEDPSLFRSPTSGASPLPPTNGHRRTPSSGRRTRTLSLNRLPTIAVDAPTIGAGHPGGSSLYSTLLERGLSIGLSPSSPGFHIQPSPGGHGRSRSPSAHSWSHQRRSMSETDLPAGESDLILGRAASPGVDVDAAADPNSEANEGGADGNAEVPEALASGYLGLPGVDYTALSDRLGALRLNTLWLDRLRFGRLWPGSKQGSDYVTVASEDTDVSRAADRSDIDVESARQVDPPQRSEPPQGLIDSVTENIRRLWSWHEPRR